MLFCLKFCDCFTKNSFMSIRNEGRKSWSLWTQLNLTDLITTSLWLDIVRTFLLIMIFLILLKGYVCKLNSICLLSSKDSFCIVLGFLPICLQSICFRTRLDILDEPCENHSYYLFLYWTRIKLIQLEVWQKFQLGGKWYDLLIWRKWGKA